MIGKIYILDKPIDVENLDIDKEFKALESISLSARYLLDRNIAFFYDIISKSALHINAIIRSQKMNLFEINERLRREDLLLWPFLEEIDEKHPNSCFSVIDDKPCKYAIYIFVGSGPAFMRIELRIRNRSIEEHIRMLKEEVPGYISPKE